MWPTNRAGSVTDCVFWRGSCHLVYSRKHDSCCLMRAGAPICGAKQQKLGQELNLKGGISVVVVTQYCSKITPLPQPVTKINRTLRLRVWVGAACVHCMLRLNLCLFVCMCVCGWVLSHHTHTHTRSPAEQTSLGLLPAKGGPSLIPTPSFCHRGTECNWDIVKPPPPLPQPHTIHWRPSSTSPPTLANTIQPHVWSLYIQLGW